MSHNAAGHGDGQWQFLDWSEVHDILELEMRQLFSFGKLRLGVHSTSSLFGVTISFPSAVKVYSSPKQYSTTCEDQLELHLKRHGLHNRSGTPHPARLPMARPTNTPTS